MKTRVKMFAIAALLLSVVAQAYTGDGAGFGPRPGNPGDGFRPRLPDGGGRSRLCAENQLCNVDGPTWVVYGPEQGYAGGGFTSPVLMTGTFSCENNTFLYDPAKNIYKACYAVGPARDFPEIFDRDSERVFCAAENSYCSIGGYGQVTVMYGADRNFTVRRMSGGFACNNQTFGVDPAYGLVKQCYTLQGWTFCSAENGMCQVPAGFAARVRYGANGTYTERTVNGSIFCGNQSFGDPIYGVPKSCSFMIIRR